MRYLLDTHVLLWYFEDSPKLPEPAALIIENPVAQKFVSVASLWELSIKTSLGKLQFDGGVAALWEMVTANGFTVLPIAPSHLVGVTNLPFLHCDPFDRLLIATAASEEMTLLSADENIHKYEVKWAW